MKKKTLLTKEEFRLEFGKEYKRRLLLDEGEWIDDLDRFYEAYENGETIKDLITEQARNYDLYDADNSIWGV